MNHAGVSDVPTAGARERLRAVTENRWFSGTIVGLIVVNAIILGLETYPGVVAAYGPQLKAADQFILWIFVAELALRLGAAGTRFFRDPWNVFDAAVVLIALAPANEAFAVLRVISIFPRLRRVVEGLARAIPGIASIGAILLILFYVFAVMASKLFGAAHPGWFGTLQAAMFSLFQIMTLEGWADMVREVMTTHPHAWAFFIVYILVSTFTVLNLFIAVIVDAMQRQHQEQEKEDHDTLARIEARLAELAGKVDALARAPAPRP
jgi:voltage-gated sodium channel